MYYEKLCTLYREYKRSSTQGLPRDLNDLAITSEQDIPIVSQPTPPATEAVDGPSSSEAFSSSPRPPSHMTDPTLGLPSLKRKSKDDLGSLLSRTRRKKTRVDRMEDHEIRCYLEDQMSKFLLLYLLLQ